MTTTEPELDRSEAPVVDHHAGEPLLKRLSSLQSVWILGVLLVIVVFFTITGGSKFLSASNFSLISQNIAVWAVIGVGMTFVIITSGIDLSVGSVLVFSSVVAAKVMEAMGGDGWGTALVGLLVALVVGMAWGTLNGFLVAKAKVPALIVTLGSLVGGPRPGPGHHRRRGRPLRARGAHRLQHLRQDPRHSGAPVRRAHHRDHRRDRSAQDQVRSLHLRHRLQRVGRPPGRDQGGPAPDHDLCAVRSDGRVRGGAVAGPVRYHDHRGPVVDQPQRHRRGGDRRAPPSSVARAPSSAPWSACSSRPCCRPGSSSSASSPSGRVSPSAPSWSRRCTWTSPAAPRRCADAKPRNPLLALFKTNK